MLNFLSLDFSLEIQPFCLVKFLAFYPILVEIFYQFLVSTIFGQLPFYQFRVGSTNSWYFTHFWSFLPLPSIKAADSWSQKKFRFRNSGQQTYVNLSAEIINFMLNLSNKQVKFIKILELYLVELNTELRYFYTSEVRILYNFYII